MSVLGRCWSCVNGIDAITDDLCEKCGGAGVVSTPNRHAMGRRKEYLGRNNPLADKNTGYEKWVRFTAEVPPEIAQALEAAQRTSMGVNWDGYKKRPASATRANLVKAGLLLYLDAVNPENFEEEVIDVDAEEVVDRSELNP